MQNPRIGGCVTPHKDNTYSITHPLSTQGIWISLDDSTKENGCLWGVPGSHKQKPRVYMKNKRDSETGKIISYLEEGVDTSEYSTQGGIPLEVQSGSIVLIHGNFLHYSEKNTSDK